jgi:hypothetical protein
VKFHIQGEAVLLTRRQLLHSAAAGLGAGLMQAIDGNTDPTLAHAISIAALAPVYRIQNRIAMMAGSDKSLQAALRSIPKPTPEKCVRCEERARIIPAMTYAGCSSDDPLDTCQSGPYKYYLGTTTPNLNGPQQNFLYYLGLYNYGNDHNPSDMYRAWPWFNDGAGDPNYPLDTYSYTPNLNQTQEWSYPPDPVWQPDIVQVNKSGQINTVAGVMGVLGALWGLGAFIAAGACPVCAAAAISFALTGALIRLLA